MSDPTRPEAGMLDALFGLHGKVALITGAAGTVGSATARLLAAAGASVVVADLDGAAAERVAAELAAEGRTAIGLACDTRDEHAVTALFDTAEGRLGGVDILVNNAGIFPVTPFSSLSTDEWDRIVETNLRGYFLCARAVVRQMMDHGRGGRIVNISSVASSHPPLLGYTAYAASKGGVNAFTRALAQEVAEFGITVNALLLGGVAMERRPTVDVDRAPIKGPATQPGRFPLGAASPAQHAAAVLFLASAAAARITGELVTADCGFSLS